MVRMSTHGLRAHDLPLEGLHGVVVARRWSGGEYQLLLVLEDIRSFAAWRERKTEGKT